MNKRKKQTYRIWQAGLALALLLLLYGCTKKDELLPLSEDMAETEEGQLILTEGATGQTDLAKETGRVPTGESLHIADGEGRSQGAFAESGAVQADAVSASTGVIYVHVCGAVTKPGVYELEIGSRVYEAVEQAGGFAGDAEQNYVNQAQILEDGVKLVIPTKEEAAAGERETALAAEKAQESVEKEIGIVGGTSSDGHGKREGTDTDGRININTASEAQLCEIPGVGATRAAAIAAYRQSHGAFEKPEDIMKVSGIKEGMYEKIKDSISVN